MYVIQKAPAPGAGRVVELESIRGLAALLIVFFHMPPWNPWLAGLGIFHSAYLMVDLFFVLSGFVIYKAYAGNIASTGRLARFQFLRFGRLYPVHLVFLGVFLLIEIAKLVAQRRYGLVSPNSQPFDVNNLSALLAQVFLAQALWNSGLENTFNTPAWSISVEFYTYLVFGLVMLAFRQRKELACAVAAVLALLLSQTVLDHHIGHLLRCCCGFFMGCCVAVAIDHRRSNAPFPGVVGGMVVLAMLLYLQLKPDTHSYDILMGPLTAILIYVVVLSKGSWLSSLLRQPLLVRLGELSYSVYMSHLTVLWLASQVFRVVLKRPLAKYAGKMVPQLGTGETLLAWAGIVVSVLLLSSLTFHFVEAPCRRMSRKLVGAQAL